MLQNLKTFLRKYLMGIESGQYALLMVRSLSYYILV